MSQQPDRLSRLFADPLSVGALNAGVLVVCYAGFVLKAALWGGWTAGPHGAAGVFDFAAFWAAARTVCAGHAAQAYDWRALRPILEGAFHAPVSAAFPIYYPPAYLLLIAPLGLLPFGAAFAAWVAGGLVAYLAAAWAIFPSRRALVIALASPGALACVLVGQNGLLTAALLGAGLVLLDRRPVLAGVLFGALVFKPQMALLAPLALVAGGRWRTLATAGATAAALTGAALLLFGDDTFRAFLTASARARASFVYAGWLTWGKVQTVYGALREVGLGPALAWAGWAVGALFAAAATVAVWCRPGRGALKGAVLAGGVLLATPYGFIYDAPVLALSAIFLLRDGEARPFGVVEAVVLALAFVAPLFARPLPTTVLAGVVLCALALRRAYAAPACITEISPASSHPSRAVKASS